MLYNFQSPHCNLEIKGALVSRAFCNARPETTQKGKAKWQAALMQPAEEVGPARCITAIDPQGYRRALELHGVPIHLNLKQELYFLKTFMLRNFSISTVYFPTQLF